MIHGGMNNYWLQQSFRMLFQALKKIIRRPL